MTSSQPQLQNSVCLWSDEVQTSFKQPDKQSGFGRCLHFVHVAAHPCTRSPQCDQARSYSSCSRTEDPDLLTTGGSNGLRSLQETAAYWGPAADGWTGKGGGGGGKEGRREQTSYTQTQQSEEGDSQLSALVSMPTESCQANHDGLANSLKKVKLY